MTATQLAKRALRALGDRDLLYAHGGDVHARPAAYGRLARFFEDYARRIFGRAFVVRDDDDQNGRSWIADWRLDDRGTVDARWTHERRKAHLFGHRDVARLVSAQAGGRPMRVRRSAPPQELWLEYSGDGVELAASHASEKEATENSVAGAVIEGPYFLARRR